MMKIVCDANGVRSEEMTEEDIESLFANLAPSKDAIWEKIKVDRDRRQGAGVKVGDNWFHSDDKSRIQQIGLVMMGANIPSTLLWKTMSGAFVSMTPALAADIFAATAQADIALFAYAEQLNARVQAAEDASTIDINAGWPPTYEESIA